MILGTATGLVNVFIEPQFQEVSGKSVLTILCSDMASFQQLKLRDEESHWVNEDDSFFPFVGYGDIWTLAPKLTSFKTLETVEVLGFNFSRPVKGFKWVGLYLPNPDFDPETEEDESELHSGYCLPDGIDNARFGSDLSYETFSLTPVFEEPTQEQLDTIWSS